MLSEERTADRRPVAIAVLRLLFRDEFVRSFAVRLWDGSTIEAQGEARFTLVIKAPEALRAALLPPDELGAARAFIDGMLDCEGDLEAAVGELRRVFGRVQPRALPALLTLLLRLPKPATNDRSGEVRLEGRYDQPLAFYRAFLDRELVYSSAYFDEGVDVLDNAQIAKIDHVLRKLRLQAGERLLDVGCGWGALVVRAAERFGARVLGVTLNRRQCDEANRRILEAGIGATARVELRDYRQLDEERPFDKIVSIGMFQHVGRARLPEYFNTVHALLRPDGLFLNDGISIRGGERRASRREGFAERFLFASGELAPLSEVLRCAEQAGFETRDVENLREHYARTLRSWAANLERHREAAVEATDERTYRTWRLLMAGSAREFAGGRVELHQALFAKATSAGSVPLPPTRRDLYQ